MSHPALAPADSVTRILGDDHCRLGAVLADAKRCLATGDLDRAVARFRAFRSGLERHIEVEEGILFPAFEALAHCAASALLAVMRAEHVELRRLMAEVAAHLERASDGIGSAPLAALTARIYAHNGKEERILYPAIDREAGEAGVLDDLARRISASSRSEGRHAAAPASASATSYAAPYPGRKVTPGPG